MFNWAEIDEATVTETIMVSEPALQMDYYKIKRLSNSDLNNVQALLSSKVPQKTSNNDALEFGNHFHRAILEPEIFDIRCCSGMHALLLGRIMDACKNSSILQAYLKYSLKEVAHTFEMQGFPCKAKIDMVYVGIEGILDLKTTAATNQEDFINSINKYNYDRQMAFYLDSIGGKRAILVGVSKATFDLFFVELSDLQLNNGRMKYLKKLQEIKEFNLFEKLMELK